MIASRVCTKCKENKAVSAFGKDSHRPDNLCLHCKECKREVTRKWSKNNLAHLKEKQRLSRLAHPERGATYQEKWRKLHPEKAREWSKNNPEKVRTIARRWNELNPEAAALCNRNNKLKRKGVPGSHSKADIARIWTLQRGKCAICHCDLKVSGKHNDHIMPIALGGDNYPSNIQLLCPPCNQKKNARHPVEFMQQMGKLL